MGRRTLLITLALATAITPCHGESGLPTKLQPAEAVQSLSNGSRYNFIVRGSENGLKVARNSVAFAIGQPHPLPFISGLGLNLTVAQATALAGRSDIEQVWYVAQDLYPVYCRIIDGIEYAYKNDPTPTVLNMSLGPPADAVPIPGDDAEPLSIATKKAADAGFIVVMAIGNYYDGQNEGVVNPWCHPEWVICVGAASSDANTVWSGSARGLASDPSTWPDVVANGIDVIGPWPTNKVKPESRQQDDESNPIFQKNVPKDKWPTYTLDSGTSEATAQVSGAAAQIIAFVKAAAQKKGNVQAGDKLFALTIPAERLAATAKRGARLTGEVRAIPASTDSEIEYSLVEPWRLVKQLLMDSAVPMPAFDPSVVGAGFVDPFYVKEQFATESAVDIRIQPIKVLDN